MLHFKNLADVNETCYYKKAGCGCKLCPKDLQSSLQKNIRK